EAGCGAGAAPGLLNASREEPARPGQGPGASSRAAGEGITSQAALPGPRNHARVDAADAHRELAGGAFRGVAGLVEDVGAVELLDLLVELRPVQGRRVEAPALVAKVLRRQLPAAAGRHAVAEGALARRDQHRVGHDATQGLDLP